VEGFKPITGIPAKPLYSAVDSKKIPGKEKEQHTGSGMLFLVS
jgi:hypothetical protein